MTRSGLISTASSSGLQTSRSPRAARILPIAPRSATGSPRNPSSRARRAISPVSALACAGVSGAGATATSASASRPSRPVPPARQGRNRVSRRASDQVDPRRRHGLHQIPARRDAVQRVQRRIELSAVMDAQIDPADVGLVAHLGVEDLDGDRAGQLGQSLVCLAAVTAGAPGRAGTPSEASSVLAWSSSSGPTGTTGPPSDIQPSGGRANWARASSTRARTAVVRATGLASTGHRAAAVCRAAAGSHPAGRRGRRRGDGC